jgi:FkbM family methyltransferase
VRALAKTNRALMRLGPQLPERGRIHLALHRRVSGLRAVLPAATPWGGRFECDLQDLVQSRIFYFGVWEPNLTAFVQQRVRPGDVVVDVGANVGYFTLLASRLVGDAGRVVAIEASPRVFGLLNRNIALTGARNVRAINVAVSDRHGSLPIYAGPPDNVGATSVRDDWYGGGRERFEATVPAAPLASLLEPDELQRVRLLKIDVEGAELPVVLNLLDTMHEFGPDMDIVVEMSPRGLEKAGLTFEEIAGRFREFGYAWYALENEYDLGPYLQPQVRPPVRGTATPSRQVDVVFTKSDLGSRDRSARAEPASAGALDSVARGS